MKIIMWLLIALNIYIAVSDKVPEYHGILGWISALASFSMFIIVDAINEDLNKLK